MGSDPARMKANHKINYAWHEWKWRHPFPRASPVIVTPPEKQNAMRTRHSPTRARHSGTSTPAPSLPPSLLPRELRTTAQQEALTEQLVGHS